MQLAAAPIELDSVKGYNFLTIQSTSTKRSMIFEALI